MIVYIDTKKDPAARVMSDIGEIMGMGAAGGVVRGWYNLYNEFVYNTETGELVFYKKAYSGYWEANQEGLNKLN